MNGQQTPAARVTLVTHAWDTVISIEAERTGTLHDDRNIPAHAETEVVSRVDAFVAHVSTLCSLHSPSELTRLNAHRVDVGDIHPDLAEMLAFAEQARAITEGRFDHRKADRIDLYAIAKGWAAEKLALMLEAMGYDRVAVNMGGDIFVISSREPWVIGLAHPDEHGSVFGSVTMLRGAVCTSGNYERPGHLVSEPKNRSCTVTGPSGALADAYATAGCFSASGSFDWLPAGYRVAAVPTKGRLYYSNL